MSRLLGAALTVAALAPAAPADEPPVRLAVRPMAAPRPAFRYQLLPEVAELNPGNAAQEYLKCFMEQQNFFFGKEAVADRARYQAAPLAELPLDKLRSYGGFALRQADWAARLDTIDWQTLRRVQSGGFDVLPPELGPLQVLGAALQVRFRAEVAGRRFDDAVRTAQTMLALARHLGEHPAEVANLVGLAVAHLAVETLQEMVQQPGCPNLYWALTALPSPLVDVRRGVQGGRALVTADFRLLRDDAPMPEADMEAFVSRLSGGLNFARAQAGRPPRNLRAALHARAGDPEHVRAARVRLIGAGAAPALVQRLAPVQVVLLDEKRAFEIKRDERTKVLCLPVWQLDAVAGRDGGASEGLLADLLPHLVRLRQAQGELERQIALIRHVEALRLYAADHAGKLPVRLADCPVPVPPDPVTGKPFAYALDGATARVGSRYEITVRK